MTALDQLIRADDSALAVLGFDGVLTDLPRGAKFDNRPTWDNGSRRFDNRPTWDNWNKK
jgi:hypothetical protein